MSRNRLVTSVVLVMTFFCMEWWVHTKKMEKETIEVVFNQILKDNQETLRGMKSALNQESKRKSSFMTMNDTFQKNVERVEMIFAKPSLLYFESERHFLFQYLDKKIYPKDVDNMKKYQVYEQLLERASDLMTVFISNPPEETFEIELIEALPEYKVNESYELYFQVLSKLEDRPGTKFYYKTQEVITEIVSFPLVLKTIPKDLTFITEMVNPVTGEKRSISKEYYP